MAIKNLSTLKTQFTNFINRIAPFNTDPLIQKGEHDQVMQDQLDSAVWKKDSSVNVVTAGVMNLDAAANDLFIIDTSGDGAAAYTININNLENGQRVRVQLTKKVADIITVGGSEWWPVRDGSGNIEQTGLADLSFEAWSINGTVRLSRLKASKISDSTSLSESFSIASSKALKTVSDIVNSLVTDKADKNQGAWTNIALINGWVAGASTPQHRQDQFGIVHFRGQANADASSSPFLGAAASVPSPSSSRTMAASTADTIGTGTGTGTITALSDGQLAVGIAEVRAGKKYNLDGVTYSI